MIMRKLINTFLVALLPLAAWPQSEADVCDESEQTVRENPVIEGADAIDEVFNIVIPPYIHQKKNRITYNGADWSGLRRKLSKASSNPVSIVHIGDSHVQADYATGEIRDNLQYDYGNAGRGLITPLKMSGTNQPHDYTFSSSQGWTHVKLMGQSWPRTMGFTGTSVTPVNTSSNFLVATSDRDDYDPFSSILIFHRGQFFVTSVTDADGKLVPFISTPSKDYTHISLARNVNSAKIGFDSAGDLTLFGVSLSGSRPGLFYHTVGNNGACYDTYNRIGMMGEGISPLSPDLVIISLGTNEAFGRVDKKAIMNAVDRLVGNIRRRNPDAEILLVTPMECQKASYSTVKTKSKKRGRRSRVASRRVRSYKPNEKIAPVRDAILEYARRENIAVYDWYAVAGGEGASEKWIADGLFSGDRIHHTLNGYRLWGLLMYQALRGAFNEK